jgi:SAM-dependent methyltransferase
VAEASALDRKLLGRFDLALFIGTLEHVTQPVKALKATRRVLAKGGRIVVITPHRANLFFLLRRLRQGGDGRIFTSGSVYDVGRLRRLAGSSGLAVESVHPLPFSIDRPGEPSVPTSWRMIAAILRHLPTAPTRGAFALVLKEGPGSLATPLLPTRADP